MLNFAETINPPAQEEEEQYRRPRVSPTEISVGVLSYTRRAQEPAHMSLRPSVAADVLLPTKV